MARLSCSPKSPIIKVVASMNRKRTVAHHLLWHGSTACSRSKLGGAAVEALTPDICVAQLDNLFFPVTLAWLYDINWFPHGKPFFFHLAGKHDCAAGKFSLHEVE